MIVNDELDSDSLKIFEQEYKEFCLELKLSKKFPQKINAFSKPRFRQILKLLALAYRSKKYEKSVTSRNKIPFIDFFSPVKAKQIYGVPMGGIGTGTIGRSYTGEFTRYQLVPGIYEHETCEANMFTVCLRKKKHTVYQQALCTKRVKQNGFKSWNMAFCGDNATYYALYPESWTVYNLPGQHVRLTCHQISPVIPHNYKDSSLPVTLFNWTVDNRNGEDIELSLMFTWQAGSSSDKFELTDVSSQSFENYNSFNTNISGCVIKQKLRGMPLEYCLAAKKSKNAHVTFNCQFYTDDENLGTSLWADLLEDGQLNNTEFDASLAPKRHSSANKLTVAVCVTAKLKAESTETIDFSLVWWMPHIFFGGNQNKVYKRYYTKFFNDSNSLFDISCYSFSQKNAWINSLLDWRRPILKNENASSIYKCALFNELYFLSDGGTLWIDAEHSDIKHFETYGLFAYLEGHEYRMYNTYDVHFYANFALLQLWPNLHLSIQYHIAETINLEDREQRLFLFNGKEGWRKTLKTVPHDVGDPDDQPWTNLNAYLIHDAKDWKDLNLKFILTVYRDYFYLKDNEYLEYMWPYIKLLMITVQSQDHDGDGLIDSEGLPDQTYDAWSVTGASAYCGGLHVATLSCVCKIASILGDTETLEKYEQILKRAKEAYDKKLWNGKYYKYDCSNSDYNDSIMTDMCCGHWYLRCSGFENEVFDKEKIQSCLESIFAHNVAMFEKGKRGAVNGMRPDGSVDKTSIQSEEMWIGVTNSFVSLLIFENLHQMAWSTLDELYKSLYYELGLAFQTPEALNKKNEYRSLGYMRPLSIWAVQMKNYLEEYCWTLKLSYEYDMKLQAFVMPRIKQAIAFIPLSLRYLKYHRECKKKNIQPHMDFFEPVKVKQIYGVPMGGIGTGTIGRSYTGEFTRYQLVPGIYEHETCEANMFTVCLRKKKHTVYQQALCTKRVKQNGFKSWNMAFCGDNATYYALYPESWTVYNLPGQHVRLTCHQISPVIPHNYKDSSLPVTLFNWTVDNRNGEDIELSLMFTWQAGSSSDKFELTDVSSQSFENYNSFNTNISGCVIKQKLRGMPLEYCLAAKKSENARITYNCQFYSHDENSGSSLWTDLITDGNLDNKEFDKKKALRNKLAIAVCVQIKVPAHSKDRIEFALVWNMPNVSFVNNQKTYKKFYTRYFSDENPDCAKEIACYSLHSRKSWQKELSEFRQPIIEDQSLPKWYKIVLFNELYFISDGGTVWFDIKNDPNCKHQVVREYGRFAYLEGQEYRMYNTYDVHFNANFALLQLWPKLQLSLQYEFADTIPMESKNDVKFLIDGKYAKQKSKNSLPHDIGDPYREPWSVLNAYNSHDTRDWKDLNLKFILTVYRDYFYLKDNEYLEYMWPYIKLLMITVQSQDHDGDGLIDSEGLPDQTYDAWSVTGASAYCGGLHVATLSCVCKIASILGDTETLEKYEQILKRAKEAYDKKLWNGKYYKYDCSNSDYNDSIMTDMCCGHWYLRCSGFENEVFQKDKIKSCLETIFEYNVLKYANGKAGSVNGMRPNGSVDITSMQSEEMWVGTTCALASLMIFEGMNDKAWKTLEGMYDLLYNKLGLTFQTPEALMMPNVYRSLGYMRALCIWSVHYALQQKNNK